MSQDENRSRYPKKRLKAFRGRGAVYSWLRAHHAQIAEEVAKGETSWSVVAAELSREGVVGSRSAPPTPKAVGRVWQRVARDVEQARQREAAKAPPKPGSIYPSRTPADWRPEPVTPGTSLVPASPGGGVPTVPYQKTGESTAPAGPEKPYDWRERVASLKRSINERSGRQS